MPVVLIWFVFLIGLISKVAWSLPDSCLLVERLAHRDLEPSKTDVREGPLFRLLGKVGVGQKATAKQRQRVSDYQEKLKAWATKVSAAPGSDAYHAELAALLREGLAVEKETGIRLTSALATAYVQAKQENPPFWKKQPPLAETPEWKDVVEEKEKVLAGKRSTRSAQFKKGDLGAKYVDQYAALEDPNLNVYFTGAQDYSLEGLSQTLRASSEKFRGLAKSTGYEGHLKDAANVIALQQKMGFPVEVPDALKGMVARARVTPYTDTPMQELDRYMKNVVAGTGAGEGLPKNVAEWLKDFEQRVGETGQIPEAYEPMVAGSIYASDGTHGRVLILRHPSSGLHAFFEIDPSSTEGKLRLTGRNEALVDGKEGGEFQNSERSKFSCSGCHSGTSPSENAYSHGQLGHNTGGPFKP